MQPLVVLTESSLTSYAKERVAGADAKWTSVCGWQAYSIFCMRVYVCVSVPVCACVCLCVFLCLSVCV